MLPKPVTRMVGWVRSKWTPVKGFWSDYPSLDWALTLAFVGAEWIAVARFGHGDLLRSLPVDRRVTLYQTLATVSVLTFGFSTATIAFFYASVGGKRASLLTTVRDKELIRTWKAVVGAPLAVMVLCVGLLIFDRTKVDHSGFRFYAQGGVLLLVFRIVRLRWLFIQMIGLVTRDSQEAAAPSPLPVASPVLAPRPKAKG
jgi:hypothetical protein